MRLISLLTLCIAAYAALTPIQTAEEPTCETVLDGAGIAGEILRGSVPLGPKPVGCTEYEVIIARGTGENGTFGAIVGDPLMKKLTKELGTKVQGYAVQYPASANVFAALNGATDVVNRLRSQVASCPNQVFVLVGYSQGAGVMAAAASNIPLDIQDNKIKALLAFGDPLQSWANKYTPTLMTKLYENCEACDMVCDKGFDFGPHLHYQRPEFMDKSADFVLKALAGTPLPAKVSVPEIKSTVCSARAPPVTITVPCDAKATTPA